MSVSLLLKVFACFVFLASCGGGSSVTVGPTPTPALVSGPSVVAMGTANMASLPLGITSDFTEANDYGLFFAVKGNDQKSASQILLDLQSGFIPSIVGILTEDTAEGRAFVSEMESVFQNANIRVTVSYYPVGGTDLIGPVASMDAGGDRLQPTLLFGTDADTLIRLKREFEIIGKTNLYEVTPIFGDQYPIPDPTTLGTVPTSGTALYTGVVGISIDDNLLNLGPDHYLVGDANVSLDFDSGAFTGTSSEFVDIFADQEPWVGSLDLAVGSSGVLDNGFSSGILFDRIQSLAGGELTNGSKVLEVDTALVGNFVNSNAASIVLNSAPDGVLKMDDGLVPGVVGVFANR